MKRRVADLPACKKCEGRYVPLILCDTCGGASVLRDLREIDDRIPCPDCSSENVTQVLCERCHDRKPLASLAAAAAPKARRPSVCPSCATFLGPKDRKCPTCGHVFEGGPRAERVKARRTRRIRGDLDAIQSQELQRIPGVTPDRVQALAHAGYVAPWKLRRATEADLAAVPEIGPDGAREIMEALQALPESTRRSSREPASPDEEFECPLCSCLTSGFSVSCRDCRAAFEEEEMDEAARANLIRDGDQGLLAFYDLRLMDEADDEDLWYARGILLDSLGRPKEALESFEKASALNPGKRKVAIARSRVLARVTNEPTAAEQLRTTLREVVNTAALEQELVDFQRSVEVEEGVPSCVRCGKSIPVGAEKCPACGAAVGGPPAEERDELDLPEAPAPEQEMQTLDSILGELEAAPEREEPEPSVVSETKPEPERVTAASETQEETPKPVVPPREPDSPHVSTPSGFRTRSFLHRRPKRGRGTGFVNGAVNGTGLVNGKGLVNGRGRVNGFINGKGRVNGLVNGVGRTNGLVNGRGYVNGARLPARSLQGASRRTTLGFLIAGIVMAVLIGAALYLPVTGPTGSIAIDGSFVDWAGIPALDAATSASNPDIELARYASVLDRDRLYLFAATRGSMFGDSVGYDGIYFLVDADGDSATGLAFEGLGADHVLEAYGGNGTVVGARGFSFPSGAELNWSRRQAGASVDAAASSQGVELRVSTFDLEPFNPDAFRVAVLADDYEGGRSRGEAFLARVPGAVRMQVVSLTTVLSGGATDLLEIQVRGLGFASDVERWTVSSLRLNATFGLITSLSAESINLTRGQPSASLRVSGQAPGFLPGDSVEVDVLGATAPRPVFVVGGPARAYVQSPNASKRVDGLFADWATERVPDSDPSRVDNPDLDIARYGAARVDSTAYFHVQVSGLLLAGSLPQRLVPILPGSTGGGPSPNATPEPRRTGEDILRIYADENSSDTVGFPFVGIFADYLLEIRGHGGRITSRTLYAWTGAWTRVPGPVPVAKNATSIEGSLPLGPAANVTRVVFEATDWSNSGDLTDPIATPSSAPLRASAVPGLQPLHGASPGLAEAKALGSAPNVDGDCGASEYSSAGDFSAAGLTGKVGTSGFYVYVCVEITGDADDDPNDEGVIYFDTNHDGASPPEATDRKFRVISGSTSIESSKGDGVGWTACNPDCDSGNSAAGEFRTNNKQVYEFKIRFANVWGTDTPTSNQQAGFAVIAKDDSGGSTFRWGNTSPSDTDPSTWGHLEIPEFRDFLVPVVSILLFGLLLRRRRQIT